MKSIFYSFLILLLAETLMSSGCGSSGGGGGVTTVASGSGTAKVGSNARFAIVGDRLYMVDHKNLTVVNITNPKALDVKSKFDIGSNIETIYPFRNSLFIGSQNGMYAYNIDNPDNPKDKIFVNHVRSCDPVVANATHAYLTLRGGTNCNSTRNELQTYSYTKNGNGFNINFLNSYGLKSPRGLGLQGDFLLVCDVDAGIKVFDVAQNTPTKVNDFATPGTSYYDIITYGDFAVVHNNEGVTYLSTKNLPLVSVLKTIK
jgi:hypothetical protein